jgi:putative ATP-dependent endonuclease of the OLD family
VILVEGEGDHQVLEHLLSRLCDEAGGHYARGVSTIEVGGKGNFKHLLQLADTFGVRSFVLADKDALLPDDRTLLKALDARQNRPEAAVKNVIRAEADTACPDHATALTQKRTLNRLLEPFGAYVLSSDLEGLLLDAFGTDAILEVLGPNGEGALGKGFCDSLSNDPDAREKLARAFGSKGWEGSIGSSSNNKLQPHLPRIVFSECLGNGSGSPDEVADLEAWLQGILGDAAPHGGLSRSPRPAKCSPHHRRSHRTHLAPASSVSHVLATVLLRSAADRCGELRQPPQGSEHVSPAIAASCGFLLSASDGTRTRDLRRDRPAF